MKADIVSLAQIRHIVGLVTRANFRRAHMYHELFVTLKVSLKILNEELLQR